MSLVFLRSKNKRSKVKQSKRGRYAQSDGVDTTSKKESTASPEVASSTGVRIDKMIIWEKGVTSIPVLS